MKKPFQFVCTSSLPPFKSFLQINLFIYLLSNFISLSLSLSFYLYLFLYLFLSLYFLFFLFFLIHWHFIIK
ncbi:hypothetical protein J3Q64DRAFT_1726502 [Phycomyces blakesleeanus]|uniref:Uncharacterized protein n=1 Tax=Phycomyces blakesleeanus TaxID=4837 RepID=A0ABR3B7H8_PHYBL